MNKQSINLYKSYRVYANLTQEQAASLLHISVRALSDYETGKTPVSNDMAVKMADIYDSPELVSDHIRQLHPAFEQCIPKPFDITNAYHLVFLFREAYKQSGVILNKLDQDEAITEEEIYKSLEQHKKKLYVS
jgi:transcriptional regulator with XRE-family HTH domain